MHDHIREKPFWILEFRFWIALHLDIKADSLFINHSFYQEMINLFQRKG